MHGMMEAETQTAAVPVFLTDQVYRNGFGVRPVGPDHVFQIHHVPDLHKDPFDRILVAQSLVEGVMLLTADPWVARYPAPIRRI